MLTMWKNRAESDFERIVSRIKTVVIEDRDINAAQNLSTLGFRGSYACGQEGSGSDFGQNETDLGEAGTQSLVTSISYYI